MTVAKGLDLRRALEEGYRFQQGVHGDDFGRLEYLSDYIFDFITYDGEMSEMLARHALEVCVAINNENSFEYIRDPERYRRYVVMANMPFFARRLNWGTSIRGAWWDEPITLQTCGLWLDGKQLADPIQFTQDQWRGFIAAMLDFAGVEP